MTGLVCNTMTATRNVFETCTMLATSFDARLLPSLHDTADVLEHMPRFEHTVATMVRALRPGGMIVEHSPFEKEAVSTSRGAATAGSDTDEAAEEESANATQLHYSNNGITMAKAMGPSMRLRNSNGNQNIWQKHRDHEHLASALEGLDLILADRIETNLIESLKQLNETHLTAILHTNGRKPGVPSTVEQLQSQLSDFLNSRAGNGQSSRNRQQVLSELRRLTKETSDGYLRAQLNRVSDSRLSIMGGLVGTYQRGGFVAAYRRRSRKHPK